MRETRKQSEIQDNNNNKHESIAANRNRYSTISWIKQQRQQHRKAYKWKKAQNTGLHKIKKDKAEERKQREKKLLHEKFRSCMVSPFLSLHIWECVVCVCISEVKWKAMLQGITTTTASLQ